jgi:hypothetical protein
MRMIKQALVFVMIGTTACALDPFNRRSTIKVASDKPPVGGIVEFRLTSYDGKDLDGRVLVGATVDPLVIDRRLPANIDVELDKLRACDQPELLKHLVFEALLSPAKDDELVTLLPGYWFGKEIHFGLFDEKLKTRPGPDCLEADLVVRAADFQVVARLPIRAHRTNPAANGGPDK